MEIEKIIIEPVITEKSVGGRELSRYVFRVNLRANKMEIKQAVERAFKVKVAQVNTTLVRPKSRSVGRSSGRTARAKKAYVTLQKGQKIQELET